MSIKRLSDKLTAFNVNNTIREILDTNKYKTLIPEMIKDRLNKSGLYSTGKQIVTYAANGSDVYAPYTIVLKQFVGQSSNKVTLNDTGAFHQSFALKPRADNFIIDYNEDKPDGVISDNVDLTDVFNLSASELKELRVTITPDFITAFKNAII